MIVKHQQMIEMRLQTLESTPNMDDMDTSEVVDGNQQRQLELQYLTLLGTKLAKCVMELLVLALMKLRDVTHPRTTNGRRSEAIRAEFSQQLAMSLDHSRLESKVRTTYVSSVWNDFYLRSCLGSPCYFARVPLRCVAFLAFVSSLSASQIANS